MIQNNRKGEWFELTTLPQWENYTLQEIFRIVWQAPKKQVHTMRMEKKVKVNNEEANWTKKLKKMISYKFIFSVIKSSLYNQLIFIYPFFMRS